MAADTILVIAIGWDGDEWLRIVREQAPGRKVILGPDVPDPESIAYALVWKPPHGLLATLPNLRLIHSLGAGVDHFIGDATLPDVPIARVISHELTRRMTEWVTLHVLYHFRRQATYADQQARHEWRPRAQAPAHAVRVGIMGMGVLGQDAADALGRFGFQIASWSRRQVTVPGVESFYGAEQLDAFLARTDILVSLLPLTPETRGILAMPLFRKLARDGALGGPILLNGGRGGLQVEADVVTALADGVLKAATLDVFETEPLPEESPLWDAPNLLITPHNSAPSSPTELVPGMIRTIEMFEAGETLPNLVDRNTAY